ncbi:MAG TPA: AIR synthase-related protein, partial [Methanomicrobiales archaeon]|nr:AIR synthase-related protein [Methanomicrobiales archaeon]
DEFGTQIKPTPSLGLAGRGEIRRWVMPGDGCSLAVIGENGPFFGGSILDAVTGCGGAAPPVADPGSVDTVRSLVHTGSIEAATDISRGGLLAALARLSPRSDVRLEGDGLSALFSESYGRFLVAFTDDAPLCNLNYRVIGEIGGDALLIRSGRKQIVLTPEEMERTSSYITRQMRY